LKEAGKKSIPSGARWTKINRELVDPAALEASDERFEEGDDYVIVLRVLTREEIEKYAKLTAEIRGKWNTQLSFTLLTVPQKLVNENGKSTTKTSENRHRSDDYSSDEVTNLLLPLKHRRLSNHRRTSDTRKHKDLRLALGPFWAVALVEASNAGLHLILLQATKTLPSTFANEMPSYPRL
jgi:hypothetical protein